MSVSGRAPRARGRWPLRGLAVAAALSLVLWLGAERVLEPPTHPQYTEMLAAARSMQAAAQVLATEKAARGLLQPLEIDPNRTGMIGPEFTGLTTSLGDLGAKRTVTSPDFAAALLGQIASLRLSPGAPVVVLVSGSLVGGNIAAVAAVERLGLEPVIIASLGASMWGATDPEFNWLDMMEVLNARGVIASTPIAAVLGGNGAVGSGIDPEVVEDLRASATRARVKIVEVRPLNALVDALVAQIEDVTGGAAPGLVINVGGAVVGLGSCPESYDFPTGLTLRPIYCSRGTPGVAMRLSAQGVPVLHVLNIRRMALDLGLPYDPVPLPSPGNNPAVYGSRRLAPGQGRGDRGTGSGD